MLRRRFFLCFFFLGSCSFFLSNARLGHAQLTSAADAPVAVLVTRDQDLKVYPQKAAADFKNSNPFSYERPIFVLIGPEGLYADGVVRFDVRFGDVSPAILNDGRRELAVRFSARDNGAFKPDAVVLQPLQRYGLSVRLVGPSGEELKLTPPTSTSSRTVPIRATVTRDLRDVLENAPQDVTIVISPLYNFDVTEITGAVSVTRTAKAVRDSLETILGNSDNRRYAVNRNVAQRLSEKLISQLQFRFEGVTPDSKLAELALDYFNKQEPITVAQLTERVDSVIYERGLARAELAPEEFVDLTTRLQEKESRSKLLEKTWDIFNEWYDGTKSVEANYDFLRAYVKGKHSTDADVDFLSDLLFSFGVDSSTELEVDYTRQSMGFRDNFRELWERGQNKGTFMEALDTEFERIFEGEKRWEGRIVKDAEFFVVSAADIQQKVEVDVLQLTPKDRIMRVEPQVIGMGELVGQHLVDVRRLLEDTSAWASVLDNYPFARVATRGEGTRLRVVGIDLPGDTDPPRPRLDDEFLKAIGTVRDLERFHWTFKDFSDDGLAHLEHLRLVYFGGYNSRIRGSGLDHLDASRLQFLTLREAGITDESVEHLIRFLKHTKRIMLMRNGITEDGLNKLADAAEEFHGAGQLATETIEVTHNPVVANPGASIERLRILGIEVITQPGG